MNEVSVVSITCSGCAAGILLAIAAMIPRCTITRCLFALVMGMVIGVGIAYAIM